MKATFPCLLVVLAITASAISETAEIHESKPLTPMEQFKSFISSPPVVQELVYRRKIPPVPEKAQRLDGSFEFSTNYVFVQARWQPAAFFYRQAGQPEFDSSKIQGRLAGFISSNYWSIGSTNSPIFRWTPGPDGLKGPNLVHSMVEDAMYDVAETLNMGVRHLKIGSIRWNANDFVGKSDVQNLLISGKLVASTNGYPKEMFLSYSNQVNVADYVIRYFYGTNASGAGTVTNERIKTGEQVEWASDSSGRASLDLVLPRRITSYLIIKGHEIQLEDLAIQTLRTASQPADVASFSPELFVLANRLPDQIFREGALYAKQPDGRLRLVQRIGNSESSGFKVNFSPVAKRTMYLLSVLTLNLGLLLLLGKVSRAAHAKQTT